MMALRERFALHALLPPEVVQEQKSWRQRWGLTPLIQSMAVVEYPNDPGWDDVHPIVADLLAGRKSVLG